MIKKNACCTCDWRELFIFATQITMTDMNTMVSTIPTDAILALVNSLSLTDRLWLVEQMTEQVEREKDETATANNSIKKSLDAFWKEQDDALLDAMLDKFSGDWGGDASPEEIASSLRQGPEMVREVEAW